MPLSLEMSILSPSLLKFILKINAGLIPRLNVHIFSPSGNEKILIIVPLHEHVANLSPLFDKASLSMGLLCALIWIFFVEGYNVS